MDWVYKYKASLFTLCFFLNKTLIKKEQHCIINKNNAIYINMFDAIPYCVGITFFASQISYNAYTK